MINPLSYWESDPNGYLRHALVGIAAACFYAATGWRWTLAVLVAVAVGKEGYDYAAKGLAQWEDVFFTLMGFAPQTTEKYVRYFRNFISNRRRLHRIGRIKNNTMKYTIFLLIALSIASCTKDEAMQAFHTLTIHQGEHRAKPWALKWENDGERTYEWQFTHTVRYELGDNDQCDWNKLTGASADLLQTRDNSIMVAWRYDRADSVILSVYYHADGKTFWASAPCTDLELEVLRVDSELPYIVIPATEPFRTSVRVIGNTMSVDVETIFTGQRMAYEREFSRIGRHREIYPWFGGNRTAPHDIHIGRRLINNQ